MKYMLLFSTSLLLLSFANAQKAETPDFASEQKFEKKEVDSFDSLYKVVTKSHSIGDAQLNQNVFFQVGKYTALNKKPKFKPATTLYISILPDRVISFDKGTSLSVIFSDGSQKKYQNEADYQIYSQGDVASLFVTIPAADPLRTKPIKAVRVSWGNGNLDVNATDQNSRLVLDMIALVDTQKFSFYN